VGLAKETAHQLERPLIADGMGCAIREDPDLKHKGVVEELEKISKTRIVTDGFQY
jgi:hypothetical protein